MLKHDFHLPFQQSNRAHSCSYLANSDTIMLYDINTTYLSNKMYQF